MKPVDRLGTLGTLARGAQSERPRQERQSGVVEGRGPPATGGALATLEGRGVDEDIEVEARRVPGNKSGEASAVGG